MANRPRDRVQSSTFNQPSTLANRPRDRVQRLTNLQPWPIGHAIAFNV
ncbi:MAG: hypothetical protein F6K56_09045 [Moorea sp. SIO3G5]|nr:hypothetical protein [Moorena sp. SIO3G5]